jgi:hypothetical protein
MKTYLAPLKCPVCNELVVIEKVGCPSCHTHIEGHFHVSKLSYLSEQTQYFIEVFLKNRGNIKAIEKELDISYPTVKKMLDETIVALGYKVDETTEENMEEDPIELLKSGKITALEAAKLIKKNRK